MGSNFFPRRDADVAMWSRHFLNQLESIGESLGISQAQVDAYAELNETFQQRFKAISNPDERTRSMTLAKNQALRALENEARRLARLARAAQGVDLVTLFNLGLAVPKPATRSQAPSDAPEVRIAGVVGQMVTVWLSENMEGEVKKPAGALGAALFACVSEEEPVEKSFSFIQNTTRATAKIEFPASLPAGTRVWIGAQWFGRRGQPGPVSKPVSAMLLGQPMTRVGIGLERAA